MLLKNQYYVASASLMSSPPTPIMKLEESMNLLAKPIKISLSLIYQNTTMYPPNSHTNSLTQWESTSENEFVLIGLMPHQLQISETDLVALYLFIFSSLSFECLFSAVVFVIHLRHKVKHVLMYRKSGDWRGCSGSIYVTALSFTGLRLDPLSSVVGLCVLRVLE